MLNLFLVVVSAWAILSIVIGLHARFGEHATVEQAIDIAKDIFLFPVAVVKRLVQRKP